MIKKVDCNNSAELNRLNFKSLHDRDMFFRELEHLRCVNTKEPMVRVYETKNICEVRLYAYDNVCWRYLLHYYAELVR